MPNPFHLARPVRRSRNSDALFRSYWPTAWPVSRRPGVAAPAWVAVAAAVGIEAAAVIALKVAIPTAMPLPCPSTTKWTQALAAAVRPARDQRMPPTAAPQAGAATLAGTYQKLSRQATAWTDFGAAVNTRWPVGVPSGVTTDNPWVGSPPPPPPPPPSTLSIDVPVAIPPGHYNLVPAS